MNFNPLHARPGRSRWRLLAPLALLVALGCSKKADPMAYPGEEYGYATELPQAVTIDITDSADYAGDGEYDFDEDLAEYEREPMADRSVIASRGRGARAQFRTNAPPARDAKGKANAEAKKSKAAAEAAAAGGDQAGEQAEPGDQEADDEPDHGRQIIYIAGMQISVYDLESAMARLEALPDTYGGWVHMRSQTQVVLRLPAIKLKPAMAMLATLGVVEARTLQAQDVTAEYVDLDSRIKVLRDTQTQLLELLSKAKTVEEALHVRRALDEVTMELELALGRMRQLSDLIAYSTLTVTLTERGPQDSIPTSNDPFRWVDTLGVEATEWR
ncbi:DUF4349 domain-containing protein [Enhygromyxa salina]|uniref:DUF4349 domain-containing protein n=1 Tax=Enhygromyxa salina TaxID=215803 RepID=A0A2S9YTF6_9BACT|nr:DUF4349 domain-containing protein [Enhygromyxa salina]PRQ08360.1 hypothetical protein ENSA7_19870 [Enhygromyxa salina]